MCDIDEMAVSLSRHRYDQALDDMDSAHILFDAGKYRVANNRAYYAIFHSQGGMGTQNISKALLCLGRGIFWPQRFSRVFHAGI